jgi:hypothetical protein
MWAIVRRAVAAVFLIWCTVPMSVGVIENLNGTQHVTFAGWTAGITFVVVFDAALIALAVWILVSD